MTSLILTAFQVLTRGLEFVGVPWRGRSTQANQNTFTAHYGRNETVLAALWFDVISFRLYMLDPEDLEGNFRSFMKANFFLWTYPKNSEIFAAHFGAENEKYCRGVYVWYWIELLADLCREKIKWNADAAQDPEGPQFGWSADGVEFSCWEPKHPTLNKDSSYFSYKHNRSGYIYLFVLEVYEPKLVMIIGPARAGQDEISLFRAFLKDKIPEGKYVIVDKGMKSGSNASKRHMLSLIHI